MDEKEQMRKYGDLLYLKSMLQHYKSLPSTRRIRSRSKFRELLSQELEKMENTTSIPAYSAIVPSIQSQMVDLAYSDWDCMSYMWLNEIS